MEAAYRKGTRGSFKGKLVPFYRNNAPKPSSTMQYKATDIKPNHYSSPPPTLGFVLPQDYSTTKRDPKVRIKVADSWSNLEELYGFPGDESVDKKAEIYIAMVQKRLMLERLNA